MDFEVAPYVRMALRKAKGSGVTVDDWKRIIEELDRKGKEWFNNFPLPHIDNSL